MKPKPLIVFTVLSTMCGRAGSVYCSYGPCQKGRYWNQTFQRCEPCPENTYLPQDHHRCMNCKPCTEPDRFNHEFAIKNCTTEQDTEIGCHPTWFRKKFGFRHQGECWRCSSKCRPGQVKIADCGPDHDIICLASDERGGSKPYHTTGQPKRSTATILTWPPPILLLLTLCLLF